MDIFLRKKLLFLTIILIPFTGTSQHFYIKSGVSISGENSIHTPPKNQSKVKNSKKSIYFSKQVTVSNIDKIFTKKRFNITKNTSKDLNQDLKQNLKKKKRVANQLTPVPRLTLRPFLPHNNPYVIDYFRLSVVFNSQPIKIKFYNQKGIDEFTLFDFNNSLKKKIISYCKFIITKRDNTQITIRPPPAC